MTFSISDKDKGMRALIERCVALRHATVKVGVLEDKGSEAKHDEDEEPGEMTVLEVATIHEFGAPAAGIPARSFIRGTVDEEAGEITAAQRKLAIAVLSGKLEVGRALNQLGALVSARIQRRIARGIQPPLLPRTVARKGSSKPLVNTGQLRSSISWEVET